MNKYLMALLFMFGFSLNSHAYWSCAWPYRTAASVQENTGTTLTDYQVKITITGSDLNAAYDWTSNGSDLRIVDSDDETLLDFWVDTWDQAGETATAWVKFSALTANQNRQIYIYYGNEFTDQHANVPFTFLEPGIKFHTRRVFTNPSSLAQAHSLFDASNDSNAGYGCTFIDDFTGVENSDEFGSNTNFIAYSETYFKVEAGEDGVWGIRYGADFGGGGGLYVDGFALEEQWGDDLWWANNWGLANEVLEGTIILNEGFHKLEVIGQEGGNDGGITVQFQRPGGSFISYDVNDIEIVSRACPVSNEPTVTFGAQATATCPSPLASYRLDEGGWSGAGDVVDQTGNFPGTMVGTVTEIEDTQVCGGAQVAANNQGADVSAIQTGLDLDADVGAVGSIAFWINLNNAWNDGQRRKIMDASLLPSGSASEKYFFIDKLAGGDLEFLFEDSADSDFQILELTGENRASDQWYHITVTFDFPNSSFKIYVDESLVADQLVNLNGGTLITSGSVTDLNTIQFGDKYTSPNVGGTGRSADGTFDEINIYSSVLSISEIRGLMAKTRNCPATVLPRECLGSFPNAVNSIKNRIITFGEDAQVLNNPDNTLSANTINKTSYSTLLTCDTLDCIAGDDEVNDVKPSNFQKTNAKNDITVGFSNTQTIGTTTDEFDNLTLNSQATLNFTDSVYNEFYIDNLNVTSSATVNFSPGTYWINELSLGAHSQLQVLGSGPVRLFINTLNSWSSDVLINSSAYGVAGNADELLMYFYKQTNMGVNATITGSVFASQDIDTNHEGRIFGLMTGENVTLGLGSQVSYDVNAYYGLSDIAWCDDGAASIASIGVVSPAVAVNCNPATIDIQVLDGAGAVIPDYEGTITLSTNTNHGDWSKAASASGTLNQATADSGAATYGMLAADGGVVRLYLKNTHAEATPITIESDGITETVTIDYQAAGFIFSNIPTQVSAQTSASLSIQAVETDMVTGACQALLLNNQTVEMAVECISPSSCGAASNQVNSTPVLTNGSGSVNNFSDVTLSFGDASTSTAAFTNTYNEAGSIRLWARYQLLDSAGAATGNTITGSSNSFVNRPAGFCIESPDANWQCSAPALDAGCTAFKQAGDNFNLSVTAKRYSAGSTDYCSHSTTNNFTNSVNLSHSLISPTAINGGQAGNFSLSSINLNSGVGTSALANFDDMGVFTLSAGGNTYLTVALPSNDSENIGRFYPKRFSITSSTAATYDNGNTGFTYTGQLESDGTTGSISYLTAPDFTFEVQGYNNQTLKNYLTPLYSTPVVSALASSTTQGNVPSAMTLTAGLSAGTISGPDINDRYTYTFNLTDHFVFNRTPNSLTAPFNNDTRITISSFIEPVDSVDISTTETILGTGGPIYYGRIRIVNAYGPETEPVPQLFKAEYFDGNQFLINTLDSSTLYDVSDIYSIIVSDVGDSSNNLTVGDSTNSGVPANTGLFNAGFVNTQWSIPAAGRYGAYQFLYNVKSWLKYDWNGSADGIDEDPTGIVNFGQYRGNDRIIYWKEINF